MLSLSLITNRRMTLNNQIDREDLGDDRIKGDGQLFRVLADQAYKAGVILT